MLHTLGYKKTLINLVITCNSIKLVIIWYNQCNKMLIVCDADVSPLSLMRWKHMKGVHHIYVTNTVWQNIYIRMNDGRKWTRVAREIFHYIYFQGVVLLFNIMTYIKQRLIEMIQLSPLTYARRRKNEKKSEGRKGHWHRHGPYFLLWPLLKYFL